MFEDIGQQLVNVLGISGIFMMFSIGMTMIYAVMRIFHLAHGGVMVIGAYANLFFFLLTRNIIISAIMSMLVAAASGILIQTFVYRPILKNRVGWEKITLIASIGVLITIQEGFLRFVGATHFQYPVQFNAFAIDVFGIKIFGVQLAAMILALVTILTLWIWLLKTRTGRALRAVSQDWELAAGQGINPNKIFYIAMIIGSMFAGLAGVLTSVYYNDVYPAIGSLPNLIAFSIIILGGVGSLPGSIIGALIVGAAETLTFAYLPIQTIPRGAIAFIILLIGLVIRPQGILGRKGN